MKTSYKDQSLAQPMSYRGSIVCYCPKLSRSIAIGVGRDRLLMLYGESHPEVESYRIPGPQVKIEALGKMVEHTCAAAYVMLDGTEVVADFISGNVRTKERSIAVRGKLATSGREYKLFGAEDFEREKLFYQNWSELLRYLHPYDYGVVKNRADSLIAFFQAHNRTSLGEISEELHIDTDQALSLLAELLHKGNVGANLTENSLDIHTPFWWLGAGDMTNEF